MEAQTKAVGAPTHRLDEFPAGYSLAGCSPAWPASASPAGYQYAVQSFCRSRIFQRTANSVLTVCVSPGGKRKEPWDGLAYLLLQWDVDAHKITYGFPAIIDQPPGPGAYP